MLGCLNKLNDGSLQSNFDCLLSIFVLQLDFLLFSQSSHGDDVQHPVGGGGLEHGTPQQLVGGHEIFKFKCKYLNEKNFLLSSQPLGHTLKS